MKLPPIDVLVDLRREVIETFGGLPAVKSLGDLEASLARAEHILSYSEHTPDAVTLACAVCASINRNHAVNDGNKRIAFLALALILEMNGYILDARETEAINVMFAQAANKISEEDFEAWVRRNVEPVQSSTNADSSDI